MAQLLSTKRCSIKETRRPNDQLFSMHDRAHLRRSRQTWQGTHGNALFCNLSCRALWAWMSRDARDINHPAGWYTRSGSELRECVHLTPKQPGEPARSSDAAATIKRERVYVATCAGRGYSTHSAPRSHTGVFRCHTATCLEYRCCQGLGSSPLERSAGGPHCFPRPPDAAFHLPDGKAQQGRRQACHCTYRVLLFQRLCVNADAVIVLPRGLHGSGHVHHSPPLFNQFSMATTDVSGFLWHDFEPFAEAQIRTLRICLLAQREGRQATPRHPHDSSQGARWLQSG